MNALLLTLGLSLAQAATFDQVVPLSVLAERSAAVLHGVIVEVEARPSRHGLETAYTISVHETLRGATGAEVEIVLPGGRLDGLVQQFEGVPLWDEGDEVVVFLPSDGRISIRGLLTVNAGRVYDPLRRQEVPDSLDALADAVAE